MTHHVDILVIGAGISGISMGYHLQKNCPSKSFSILERRGEIGGTWDLFRYPGIRSDSDMYTLGFSFRPWREKKAIADGPSILRYVNDTVDDHGLREKISFNRFVRTARYSSEDAHWHLDVERTDTGEVEHWSCRFLSFCAGYYNYDAGYAPDFNGVKSFEGRLIHPQHWPKDLDYQNKRVVVIGSGATAVTIVPEIAKDAAHVTMLQRSPTYMVSRPSEDGFANFLQRILPEKIAYAINRWRNITIAIYFFALARAVPNIIRRRITKWVRKELPEDYDVDTHFNPHYNPWDQRLCLVPDSDFFKALTAGSASIITDEIEKITERGLQLKSGKNLDADIIVTATGLELQTMGGAEIFIDGQPLDASTAVTYKGMMLSNTPNMCFTFGYTNASWTLKADLTSQYLCRLLNFMDENDAVEFTPILDEAGMTTNSFIDFSSGYFQRAAHRLPKQGTKKPWRLNQNYALDLIDMRFGKVDDGTMQFRRSLDVDDASAPMARQVNAAE